MEMNNGIDPGVGKVLGGVCQDRLGEKEKKNSSSLSDNIV